MPVHILASCRKPELLPAATLVFESIRKGFKNSHLYVTVNHVGAARPDIYAAIEAAAKGAGAEVQHDRFHHHFWIEALCTQKEEPFWICDTDVVFFDDMERWPKQFDKRAPIAGRWIPGFSCEFTRAWTMPRVHTSLMWIDPVKLRAAVAEYYASIPTTYFTPKPNVFYPQFVPEKVGVGPGQFGVRNVFYDTCSILSNAVLHQPFCEEQLDCYGHLHCGTLSDVVGPHILDGKMQERHRQIFANPELARGLWKTDLEYYASRGSARKSVPSEDPGPAPAV